MKRVQRIRVPADLERLSDLRRFIRDAAAEAGAAPSTVDDMVQAVDEAAANAIEHGYAGSPGTLDVMLSVVGDSLVVRLEDGAPPFDPTLLLGPDMTVPALLRGPRGMGIRLIRLAVDRLDYAPRAGGGNALVMTRSMAARPEEDR